MPAPRVEFLGPGWISVDVEAVKLGDQDTTWTGWHAVGRDVDANPDIGGSIVAEVAMDHRPDWQQHDDAIRAWVKKAAEVRARYHPDRRAIVGAKAIKLVDHWPPSFGRPRAARYIVRFDEAPAA